jgi:hypothetical protein
MRRPCRMVGGKRPVPRPAEERGLKLSLATSTAKASEHVIADPHPGSASIQMLPWLGSQGEGYDLGAVALSAFMKQKPLALRKCALRSKTKFHWSYISFNLTTIMTR